MTLTLYRCRDCSFIFCDDREVPELSGLPERLIDPVYELTAAGRLQQMRRLLSLGRQACPEARTILDIGAATGILVAEARAQGLEAVGIEPSHALVETARRTRRVTLLQGTFPHPALAGQRFDLIFAIDVIQHVADPVGLLQSVEQTLAPGGLALITTPDIGSLAARLMGRRWWHLRLSHAGYFNRRSFGRAAETAGLSIQASSSATWFLPLFYVSERVAVYAPFLRPVNRAASALPLLKRLWKTTVQINVRDSSLFYVRRIKTRH